MSRNFRNFLWFLVGCIAAAVPLLSMAETIPAVQMRWARVHTLSSPIVYGPTVWVGMDQSSVLYQLACEAAGSHIKAPDGCVGWSQWQNGIAYNCPTGQGWTFSSSGNVCTRPDCAEGETRGEDGICRGPECPPGEEPNSSGVCVPIPCSRHYEYRDANGNCVPKCIHPEGFSPAGLGGASGSGGSMPGSVCVDACVFPTTTCVRFPETGAYGCGLGPSTGNTCDPDAPAGDDDPKPAEPLPKDSPESDCVSQGKAYGQVNGKTVCVQPDQVSTKNKTEQTVTRPDGTTGKETTNTTTVCSGAGSCTTTTVTTVSGGGSTGEKPDGETTTTTTGNGACKANPDSPACKPGFTKPTKGEFPGKESDIEDAEQALTAKVNQIKTQIAGLFQTMQTGSGGLPCDGGVPVRALGINFNLCFATQEGNLQPLQIAILVIAALASLVIIFR
ncbi:MAG: hypothetical protein H3C26_12365 [Rhodocyclaceae bacterium]|nr:hypothetical protein [Rhodocyclaceae bacterium]